MIEIKHLNRRSLEAFIASNAFLELDHLPISRHRALSHIRNPRAQEGDVLLLIAYKEEKLVGYLGVLPDEVMLGGEKEACGWMSCLWVDSNCRGMGIAGRLVGSCIEAWEGRLFLTEFTQAAKRLYDKSGHFRDLVKKPGLRLYLGSELSRLLPPRFPGLKKVEGVLKGIDRLINTVLDLRFILTAPSLKGIQLEYVLEVDEQVDAFIAESTQRSVFGRRAEELNWLLRYPWVLPSTGQDAFSDRYHFSSIDTSFDFIPVKIYDSKTQLIGFLIFAKRADHLKVPYCYFSGSIEPIIEVINYHLVKWRVRTFTTFDSFLVEAYQSGRSPALLKRKLNRAYMVGSGLHGEGGSLFLQDGDGDCAFT